MVRERYERTPQNLMAFNWHDVKHSFGKLLNLYFLFFRYAPLSMSLHDAVADDSFRGRIEKSPHLRSDITVRTIFDKGYTFGKDTTGNKKIKYR
jgi:hypothetical protein